MTIQPSAACFLILQSTETLLLLWFGCRGCAEPGGCFPRGVLSNKDIQPKRLWSCAADELPIRDALPSCFIPAFEVKAWRENSPALHLPWPQCCQTCNTSSFECIINVSLLIQHFIHTAWLSSTTFLSGCSSSLLRFCFPLTVLATTNAV